jgi:hypothetical protein
MFGFLQGYFSLPQGYPYQWGSYVYYPAPYIPPHLPMYSYPESCCCYGYEIETVLSEISNQEISGDGDTMTEVVPQMTSTVEHPTTTTTIGQFTEGLRAESTTESTTNEFVSPTETAQHLPETNDRLTTESSESTARSTDESTKEATEPTTQITIAFKTETTAATTLSTTDESTKEATEPTTQTTVDFKTETTAVTTASTTDSKPKEENQYNIEEGTTTSTIRTTESDMIINTVTGKEYILGRTTEVSAEPTSDNYQHFNTTSNSELTTESKMMSRFVDITQTFSEEIYDENSQTEDEYLPYIDAA